MKTHSLPDLLRASIKKISLKEFWQKNPKKQKTALLDAKLILFQINLGKRKP